MGLLDFLKKPKNETKNEELNPLRGLMNLGNYTVSGTNPKSGRKKTVVVCAGNADDAQELSGLTDCTVEETGWGEPTASQLDYIHKNGLALPEGATARDATALIERMSHKENSAVPSKLVIEAAAKGVSMSFLTGQHQYARYMEDWERGARGSNGRS